MSFLIAAVAPPCFTVIQSAASQPRRGRNSKNTQKSKQNVKTTKPPTAVTSTTNNPPGFGGKGKNPVWQCVQNCGACCKLDKGPDFPSPEEVFDDPSDIQLYKSLVGSDGWCIHYEKSTRKCSIYAERPYFCRVEPEIFETLYGIDKKKFNKEACSVLLQLLHRHYQSSVWIKFNRTGYFQSSNMEHDNIGKFEFFSPPTIKTVKTKAEISSTRGQPIPFFSFP
nr:uncharacterized protein LOC109180046 [Ipomoea batatas]